MKLSELLERAGEDVQWQLLHECFISAQSTKRGTQVTFGTQAITTHELVTEDFKNVGLIIWIPKEKWPAPHADKRPCEKETK